MNWIKTIAIIVLASSFLLKDIAALISFHDNGVYCYEDINEDDASEKKETEVEDEKYEWNIHLNSHFSLKDGLSKIDFRTVSEKLHFGYHLEINSPPPEFV